ncbi:CemA family protein [Aphanizomenon sp. CS-733/32]|uniref:CemA family protein n=1 Tax=Aphanizomenon sp. CS-733/32 TaxID=3021715 RepID=UPI00232CE316|nr:CemA family protein [Aphanizomenon sp. CS-733/32]MDB9308903.1 CemA family protein [Aphanizomenon sp. CS-733/32]
MKKSSRSNQDVSSQPFTFLKTGIFPRSIGKTFQKILIDISPNADQEFIKKYQISRQRTTIAIKFLLLLVIIPLLTHQLSKHLLILPIVENLRNDHSGQIFLNQEMEEKAFHELKIFTAKLRFESLLDSETKISPENQESKIKAKAIDIAAEFQHKSNNAISNIFADIMSLIAFALVIVFSTKDIISLQQFIDQVVYGLSDSAKAFLIILSTDVFVGFHSPHGWEVILEGFTEHLGLPANRNYIFMFIATFPVILDTIVKYWIFRYLSRLSPSALATLKEMND